MSYFLVAPRSTANERFVNAVAPNAAANASDRVLL
jgi:hypothetical protein